MNLAFDKQHMVDHFGFEAPFAPNGGKISEDVDKQWKRRTIYVVPKFYPAVLRRSPLLSLLRGSRQLSDL